MKPLYDDFLVVTVDIDEFDMKRILVDGESSTNIFYPPGAVNLLVAINLLVVLSKRWKNMKIYALFIVVDALASYNIFGDDLFRPIWSIPST